MSDLIPSEPPHGNSTEIVGIWSDVPAVTQPVKHGAKRPEKEKLPFVTRVLEYLILIVVAVVIASLIRVFVGLAFYIPSESMYPTLKIGDRVVVSRISYRLHDPRRGDIVVFQNPAYRELRRNTPIDRLFRNLFDFVGARQPKDKNYVKRVIGLPGERLEIKNDAVFVNGIKLSEPWLEPNVKTTPGPDGKTSFMVPPNSYFMMGDNRPESADSRYFKDPEGEAHPYVDKKTMVGRAFVRVWPATRLGGL